MLKIDEFNETDAIIIQLDDKDIVIENIKGDTLLTPYIVEHGIWEPWQLDLYRRLIKPTSTILDIGANIGINALLMSHFAPQGKVFSFEPSDHIFALLERNIANNNVENVIPQNIGLSKYSGAGTLAVDPKNIGKSHLLEADSIRLEGSDQEVEVDLKRLDDWAIDQNISEVDLIKMDVEGFENEVLMGGQEFFSNIKDVLLIVEMSFYSHWDANVYAYGDLKLFLKLQELFEHIFLIGRDSTLVKVENFAKLRSLMLCGYPVDDLFCCNSVPDSICDMIRSASDFLLVNRAPHISAIAGDRMSGFIINRDADWWAVDQTVHEKSIGSGISVQGQGAHLLLLPLGDYATNTPNVVDVYIGNTVQRIDITDQETIIPLPQKTDFSTWVYIETRNKLKASECLGNQTDPRLIGFQCKII